MTMSAEFDKTISKAHLSAHGWDIGVFKHSNPFECHVLYVRDFRSDHTELFTMRMDDFANYKPPATSDEISGLLARLIKRHQRNRLTQKEKGALLPTLICYMKGTQCFDIWRQAAEPDQRLHMVINIYGEKEVLVRPFIMKSEGVLLPAEQVLEASNHARSLDRQRHPEWFGSC